MKSCSAITLLPAIISFATVPEPTTNVKPSGISSTKSRTVTPSVAFAVIVYVISSPDTAFALFAVIVIEKLPAANTFGIGINPITKTKIVKIEISLVFILSSFLSLLWF